MQGDGAAHFGFKPEHIAMLCASHNGEDIHVSTVDETQASIGRSTSSLQCCCRVPQWFSHGGLTSPANELFDERYNNCSGKLRKGTRQQNIDKVKIETWNLKYLKL